MDILDVYSTNKGQRKLLSDFVIVDWYDDVASGACKLVDNEKWFLCILCYFDPSKRERISELLEAPTSWVLDLKKMVEGKSDYSNLKRYIRDFIKDYRGRLYLMKYKYIDDVNYELTEVPIKFLKYYKSVEEALVNNESNNQWQRFFANS